MNSSKPQNTTLEALGAETKAIRIQVPRSQHAEHAVPLYLTSSYVFEDAEEMRALFADEKEGNIYSRYSNPNVQELIDKLAVLENAESGWATASGMAAVFTTFGALLQSGDHIVASRSLFGSTHRLLTEIFPKWGITSTYVDAGDYAAYAQAVQENTKLIYIETPSNPGLDIIDLEKIRKVCKKTGILYIVDNCFATPVLQRPIDFGADLVIHSTTKYLDGQGRTLGGLILGKKTLIDRIEAFARHTGPAMSPFNAWIISKSVETLHIRMQRHTENALKIAQKLEKHAAVAWVKYPFLKSHPQYDIAKKQMHGGGGIVTFELKGGLEAGRQFLDGLQLFSLTANLGDTRSIATHPASTTHSKLTREERATVGISDGLVRLSIGLEDVKDIWTDVKGALKH
jgi:O-succinylhomoserine sulfhydrylase